MRNAWTIALKDLRRRLRDRTALLVALVLPFGLAWIFSLTLGDVDTGGFTATYAVVNEDTGGHLPAAVHPRAAEPGLRDAPPGRGSEAQAARLAEDGDIDAAIVFPAGFTRHVQAGGGRADPGGRLARLEHRVAGGRLAGAIVRIGPGRDRPVRGHGGERGGQGGPGAGRTGPGGPAGGRDRDRGRRGPGGVPVHVLRDRDGGVLPVLRGGVRRARPAGGARTGDALAAAGGAGRPRRR